MNVSELESRLSRMTLPEPPADVEERVRRAARRGPRRARAWAGLAAAIATFAFVLFMTLRPAARSDAGTAASRLWASLDEAWAAIVAERERGNEWVDKQDFERAFAPHATGTAERDVLEWLRRRGGEPGLAWRAHVLLADIARDPETAARHLEAAMAAYPNAPYRDPSRFSMYQHIANDRAMLIWDERGFQAALDFAAGLLEREPRYRYFFGAPWRGRLDDEGRRTLGARVRAAYEARATNLPEYAEEARRFALQDEEPTVEDLRAGGDERKRYFLIGPPKGAKEPASGPGLVVVLPGGDGSDKFHPFVKRIATNALADGYVVAQLVSVEWTPGQFKRVVWPTEKNRVEQMKFATEEFAESVIEEVAKKRKLNAARVYTLSWSSGGPAAYAISMRPKRLVRGSFVAMSVFHPASLPPLAQAKGHAFFLYHSESDETCRFGFAEDARQKLGAAGASVELKKYDGGHGWSGDVYGDIREGVAWLERNAKGK